MRLVSWLSHMMDGWAKSDPLAKKKLLVEAGVPEFLTDKARKPGASELKNVVDDWRLVVYFPSSV